MKVIIYFFQFYIIFDLVLKNNWTSKVVRLFLKAFRKNPYSKLKLLFEMASLEMAQLKYSNHVILKKIQYKINKF
jgi:hypothetical protein